MVFEVTDSGVFIIPDDDSGAHVSLAALTVDGASPSSVVSEILGDPGEYRCFEDLIETFQVQLGVPHQVAFSASGGVTGDASIDLTASYTLITPEPNTGLMILLSSVILGSTRRFRSLNQG
ncbi:MAG: hypothetical protein ABSB35_01760 [Bryobacteraceae bacterium]|jgi:hypothetical protein